MTKRRRRARAYLLVLLIVLVVTGAIVWKLDLRFGKDTRVADASPTPEVTATPVAAATPDVPPPTPPPPVTYVVDESAEAGRLSGTVVNTGSGDGVADAELTFLNRGRASSVRTRSDGTFTFVPAAPGHYDLAVVTADNYLPYAPAWGHSTISFRARRGERITGTVIYLTPALEYTGTVFDPDGGLVAGADVEILGEDGAVVTIKKRFTSDKNGEFTFSAPDDSLLEARHREFAPARGRVDFNVQVTRRLAMRLGPRGSGEAISRTISGQVVFPTGDVAAGALVSTRIRSEDRPQARDVTDDNGRFDLRGLDAGRYDVRATLEGYGPAFSKNVPAGTVHLVLKLTTGGKLEGRVASSDGAPVAGFKVTLSKHAGPLRRETYAAKSVYDSKGRYQIDGIEAGTYAVTVIAKGYAPTVIEKLEHDGKETKTENITLSRGGRVFGSVIDELTDEPLELAKISVEATENWTTTDEAGQFQLDGLAPGERSLFVAAAHHHAKVVAGLAIEEGSETGPLQIALAPLESGEEAKIELAGIGAKLIADEEFLRIVEVTPGGGAEEAGLAAADRIEAVDGAPVVDLGFGGSIQKIRGPEGTSVLLRVQKAETEEPIEVEVFRRKIRA